MLGSVISIQMQMFGQKIGVEDTFQDKNGLLKSTPDKMIGIAFFSISKAIGWVSKQHTT